MGTARAPSGRKIWEAVREELVLNLYPLPFSTLAPTVYHVYLHPDDFVSIEGIVAKLVDQLRQALTTEVERINRGGARPVRALVSRLLDREPLPAIELPVGGWEVYIRPDPNGELTRGQLGIVSTLAMPAPVEYVGTPTTRIVRSVVGASGRSSTVSEVPQSAPPPAAPAAAAPIAAAAAPPLPGPVQRGAGAEPARVVAMSPAPVGVQVTSSAEGHGSRDRARLTYTDDQGPHEFIIRKDTVSVGRGGSAAWVDVQVVTGSRVSREHVRLRMDADGAFFVQDVSLWGTTVDDVPLSPAVKGPEGVLQPGPEQPLPARARIGLAGAITIAFEAI